MNDKLSNDLIFIVCFWGGLFLGFLLYVLLVVNNDLIFCFDLSCYERALEIFSLPLSVMAGGMGLAAFRATIFRSNQTREQINETITQNTFKNYIEHKKELMTLLDMFESAHGVTVVNRPYIYKTLFPNNSPVCVMFESKESYCEKSWLDFKLDQFNELIIKYNEIKQKICVDDKSLSKREVARWLSNYLCLIFELDITFSNCLNISDENKGLFSDIEKMNRVPPNIGNSFYVVSAFFEHLSLFALPSRPEGINIKRTTGSDNRVDKWLEVFTKHK